MNTLVLNENNIHSVASHIKFDWQSIKPGELRHPKLFSVCKRLFYIFGFYTKYLIEIVWNIPLKALINSDLVICFEWTAKWNPLMLAWLRRCFPDKRLIVWCWNLNPAYEYTELKKSGWELWSWDKNECEKFGLNYSKTFMAARYVPFRMDAINCTTATDIFFFGGDKGRLSTILKIKKILDDCGISNDINVAGQFRSSDKYRYVSPLSYTEILAKLQNCHAILDIPLPGQEGITQREMEALFFGKKLITTNPAVKNRDYYNENNIFIIYLEKPKECHFREGGKQRSAVANPPKITEFLKKPYVEIDREIIDSYLIEAWLQRFRDNESAKKYFEFQRKNFFEALKRRIVRYSFFQKNEISKPSKIHIPKNKTETGRIAVYMVNIGDYDEVSDPLVVSENCDYFLFTDNPGTETKIWRKIVVDKSQFASDLICSRYYKMLPHRFLDGKYDYSIYLDSKNLVVGDIAKLTRFLNLLGLKDLTGLPPTFAAIRHNARKNIVEEKQRCIQRGVIPAEIAEKQVADYLSQGFPDSFGLIDCRCLIRKHSDKQLQQAMEMWFAEFEKYPYRDQLSIMFSFWKSGFDAFKIIDGDVYNNQFIKQNRKE